MITLKPLADGRTCKYCGMTFGVTIEMYQSQRHGYFICVECFKDRQEQRLVI